MTEPSTGQPDDEPYPTNLSHMTKNDLLEYAEEKGIEGVDGDMTKAQILSTLKGEG